MSHSTPKTLGKYQIIREIARSNDIVYEGYDPAMNRRVAIKELNLPTNATAAQREDRVRRFQREVKAAGSLSHPGIVTIYESGEDSGRIYMAMEFLDGKTLRQELDTKGFIEPKRGLQIIREVLDALEFAHENGVIHRDIKPENIQLLSSGRVKLTDFGIARLAFEPNLTIDGQVFGTPSYMSPEQVVGKELDARSDLFSVGSVLYETLTGQKAFPGDSVVSTSYAIMNKEPDYPPTMQASLVSLISHAVAKVPSLRFSNAAAFRDEVVRLLTHGLEGTSMTVAPPPIAFPTQSLPAYPDPAYTGYAPQAVQPQPYAYTYNQMPPAQPQLPPNFQLPLYLPPPPRPPLFKPETKALMGRVVVMIVSAALLLTIAVAAMFAINQAVSQMRKPSAVAEGEKPTKNVEQANNWYAEGERRAQQGQLDEAIVAFKTAAKWDGANPAYPSKTAEVYGTLARNASVAESQIQYWVEASSEWKKAADLETDYNRKFRFSEYAAEALYNGAVICFQIQDRQHCRDLLFRARRIAPPGSSVDDEVLALLEQVGG